MKCRKALDMYFASRDGLLDEMGRLRLAEHLGRCAACARYVKEMDASLDALAGLPELSPSEGFEWNVKRRIHEERNLPRRSDALFPAVGRRWASNFAFGASAAAAIVIAAIFAGNRLAPSEPSVLWSTNFFSPFARIATL